MRKMMMVTGQILGCGAVEGTVLAMAMRMTTARVRRSPRAVRKEQGKGRVQWMRRGKVRGRQRRKGTQRETVKKKVLSNKPQEEVISLVPFVCSCTRKSMRQTRTQRANQSGYI
jgi:hypothetical protein